MKRWLALIVGLLLALSSLLPQHALAADPALGALKPVTSLTYDYVRTWNGKAVTVCQARQESWTRLHQTCHQLVNGPAVGLGGELVAGRVLDDIIYDDVAYSRVDNETTWKATPMRGFVCDLDCWLGSYAASYTVSELPRTVVNGVPVRHIQFWSTDEKLNADSGGQYIDDYFISDDGYVIANGFTLRGNVPGWGKGEMGFLWVSSHFNSAITVGRPDPSLVKQSQ